MVKKSDETYEQQEETVEVQAEVTDEQEQKKPVLCEAEAIIRKRVYAAMGVGLVPIPLVDLAGLTAVQMEMIYALTKAYGIEFKTKRVRSIVASLCGSFLSVASVPFFASLFKSIPIIGSTTGAAANSIIGGASTYALGCVFERHFRGGGNLMDFDVQGTKQYFKDKLEEGKEFVAKMKPGKSKDESEVSHATEETGASI